MPREQGCAHQPEQCPPQHRDVSPGCCPQGAARPPPPTATKSSIRQPPGMLHELGVPMSPARPCHGVPTTAASPSFPPQGSRHHLCLLATALASTPGHQNWANHGEKGLPPAGWCPPSPSQALCRLQHCYSLAMTSVITAEYILVVATGLMICI